MLTALLIINAVLTVICIVLALAAGSIMAKKEELDESINSLNNRIKILEN